jgi:molecular chaperone GrpE
MTEELHTNEEQPVVEEAPVEDTGASDELERVTRERDQYLDSLQRLKAEFDNFRKRSAREYEAMSARATERVVKDLLPVVDDLERTLEAVRDPEGDSQTLEEGVALVHRALVDLLRREGLAEIETKGKFDPHVHEALLQQPADGAEAGAVLQVLQKGYTLGDRVVRPARVIVAE